jgi:Ca2+-binding RTX toxin-like protein
VLSLGDRNDRVRVNYGFGGPALTVNGGDGIDSVRYLVGPRTLTLDGLPDDGPGRGDNIGADVENVSAGPLEDSMAGNDAANGLDGGLGKDALAGAGGDDIITSFDTLSCNPRATGCRPFEDTVSCGPGQDIADADGLDTVSDDCEIVAREGIVAGTVGDDRLVGWRERLTFYGGAGRDFLQGVGGDELSGGSGDDELRAGLSPLAASRRSTLSGGSGNDLIVGNRLDDFVSGGTGNDTIRANAGDDEIQGLAGRDDIKAGSGDDVVVSRDRGAERDLVACGPGRDLAIVDSADVVSADCERRVMRDPRR